MTNRKLEYRVIPPEADGEFVAHLEEVLDTCEQPCDPAIPVLCMDEQPVQLWKETRPPIPATKEHGRRIDYEHERAGTANRFLFTEPLAGWREVSVRERKTKLDGATETARLLEGRYARCQKVILVCDNLNTPTKGAFDERLRARACPATGSPHRVLPHAQARELAQHRGERTDKPSPSRWEPRGSLTRQCVSGRCFGNIETLREATSARSSDVNSTQRGIDWQMKIGDARGKLTSVYPKIKK